MNTKTTLTSLAALSLATILSANVFAGPDPALTTAILSSAKAQHVAKRPATGTSTEPDRIFNSMTKQFEPNPAYHEPSVRQQAARAVKPAREPRRIFDIVSGEFIPNPDYHGPFPFR